MDSQLFARLCRYRYRFHIGNVDHDGEGDGTWIDVVGTG